MRLYVDNTKCSGCRACLLACSFHLFTDNNPTKSALRLLSHIHAAGGFELRVCTQCGDCAGVCPTAAIHLTGHGTYVVEPDLCNLCLKCVETCPEGVIFNRADIGHIWKCDMCGECVPMCGTNALWVADREV